MGCWEGVRAECTCSIYMYMLMVTLDSCGRGEKWGYVGGPLQSGVNGVWSCLLQYSYVHRNFCINISYYNPASFDCQAKDLGISKLISYERSNSIALTWKYHAVIPNGIMQAESNEFAKLKLQIAMWMRKGST